MVLKAGGPKQTKVFQLIGLVDNTQRSSLPQGFRNGNLMFSNVKKHKNANLWNNQRLQPNLCLMSLIKGKVLIATQSQIAD